MGGKLFVLFMDLIYFANIKTAMSENDLLKNYTMQELLDELDIIERFEQPSRRHRIGEIPKKQLYFYKCLGVNALV